MKKPAIIHKITVENDKEVFHIPLGKSGKYAAVYKEDYDYLIGLGLSGTWNNSIQGYVDASSKGTRLRVARVLMDAKESQTVRYVDGDITNLRRDNLVIMRDLKAKRRDRDFLRKVVA